MDGATKEEALVELFANVGIQLNDSLEHFGVKGMKWGVRKDKGHEGQQVKLKKLPKLDKKWAKQFDGFGGWAKANNMAADYLNGPNGQFAKLNNRPEYKTKIGKTSTSSALYKKYMNDVNNEVFKAWQKVAKDVGVNPSGTQRFKAHVNKEQGLVHFKLDAVKHAAGDDGDDIMVAKLDADGMVTEILRMDENGELMHWGIKGMKWGQRKKRPVSADAQAKTDIKDRVRKDKVSAVSNNDLQTAIRRMQLEQDFKRLKVNEQNGFTRWVSSMMMEIGKKEVQAAVGKKVASMIAKKVVTGGAA